MKSFLLDSPVFIIILIVFASGIGRVVVRRYGLNRYFKPKQHLDNKGSLLLSFYTAGNDIIGAASGEVSGTPFRSLVTAPYPEHKRYGDIPIMDSGAIIYMLELDFNTQAHIVGLGAQAPIEALQLRSYFNSYHMEPVTLEGDFNDHFHIYAARGQQSQVRYVLDPEAMAAYIEYCRYNFWEIVGDEMYVVIGANHEKSSAVLQNAKEFVGQIRPALVRTFPGEEPVHHEPSYRSRKKKHTLKKPRSRYKLYDGPPLSCPLCSSTMTLQHNVHVCPNGHGVLMYGKELIALRHNNLDLELPIHTPLSHNKLSCPSCRTEMARHGYAGSTIMIDTCMNCAFRWIDIHELEKITAGGTTAT